MTGAPDRVGAQLLYHAALPDDWAVAVTDGEYRWSTRAVTLDEEGFVHCSYRHQLDDVVARFYAAVDELSILVIDRRHLDAPVIDEPAADDVAELFPHVYGPIPTRAVVRVVQWLAGDGVAPSVVATIG